jgi:threonine aldolase
MSRRPRATWKAGVDVLSFGATKGGAMGAEAVIFFDPKRGANMQDRRKRGGATRLEASLSSRRRSRRFWQTICG